jgi:hypothetical protein
MDLTLGRDAALRPLYREYRLAAKKVGDRIVTLINTYADNYQHLTDGAANKLLTEFVSIEQRGPAEGTVSAEVQPGAAALQGGTLLPA